MMYHSFYVTDLRIEQTINKVMYRQMMNHLTHTKKPWRCAAGFSLTPYLESFTPTFGLGTPVFPRISSNLHCGTPTFSKRCLWDSYFQNPSENPGAEPCPVQSYITHTCDTSGIIREAPGNGADLPGSRKGRKTSRK